MRVLLCYNSVALALLVDAVGNRVNGGVCTAVGRVLDCCCGAITH